MPCTCDKWRSKAFDGLPHNAWHSKADKWHKLGRKQRQCEKCRLWRWVKIKR